MKRERVKIKVREGKGSLPSVPTQTTLRFLSTTLYRGFFLFSFLTMAIPLWGSTEPSCNSDLIQA